MAEPVSLLKAYCVQLSTSEEQLPGFKDLNIFLHVMYCNGAKYLLLKALISNSGAVSTSTHGLSKQSKHGLQDHSFLAQVRLNGNVEIK